MTDSTVTVNKQQIKFDNQIYCECEYLPAKRIFMKLGHWEEEFSKIM